MAFTPYHNILGATAQDNELIALGDASRKRIKTLQITNVHASAVATVDLYLFKDSTDTTKSKTYYILNQVLIPFGVSLLLDGDILSFDNTTQTGYSMYINVGSSDTVDVLIVK